MSKREVESRVYNIPKPRTSINIKLSIGEDDDETSDFEIPEMQSLKVVAVDAARKDDDHADMAANIFYRDKWPREDFLLNMDDFSQETGELASELFDSQGRLKREFMNNPSWKGSGAFSDKNLSSGTIVHIDRLSIPTYLRRKGLGRRMVELMLEKLERKGVRWIFTWPTQLNDSEGASEGTSEHDDGTHEKNKQIAISFWRSVGFRRVGTTHWFCYAMDPTHKSRTIAAADDFDPSEGMDIGQQAGHSCTCGQCIEGFISPRMKFILSTQASVRYDVAHDSPWPDEYFEYDRRLTSRSRQLAMRNKAFNKNCLETMLWISECLNMNMVPNIENILSLVQRRHRPVYSRAERRTSSAMVAEFITSGGTIAEVVNHVLGLALDQDEEYGDGDFMETFRDEVEALPKCGNDRDFDMIKSLLT